MGGVAVILGTRRRGLVISPCEKILEWEDEDKQSGEKSHKRNLKPSLAVYHRQSFPGTLLHLLERVS
jgi:hypothetical protein